MMTRLSRLRWRARSRVGLWIAPIGPCAAPMLDNHLALLSPAEREHLDRLTVAGDRQRYLVGRVLLRTALSSATAQRVTPRQWQFDTATGGKPIVAPGLGLPPLEFNISHCRQLVVVAVGSDFPVGVDVEYLDRSIDSPPAAGVLAPGERAWLEGRLPEERAIDFLRLWTLKEAYAKLRGQGVSLDFATFEIGMDPPRIERTESGESASRNLHLSTEQVRMPDGLYQLSLAALCRKSRKPEVTVHLFREGFVGSEHGSSKLVRLAT
ncbi:MAG: 4'-phosphopantetheinyl transferase superfamily protein [Pirellulales bacterium]|nr:4'-phosphopantetheinyl transferase superfamily protein [Pirellulales bacterium]